MKIAVLNGSPKGKKSATMHYVHYIQKKFPHHELNIIDISQRINRIEKDEKAFREIINNISSSDGVLWATPVYVTLVPSQYKRFIELIFERDGKSVFKNKYAAVLVTSIHFFDHTACNYLNAVCDDLGMNYVGAFSPDMYDLIRRKEQERLVGFTEDFFSAVENGRVTSKHFAPIIYNPISYEPKEVENRLDPGEKKILVLTDDSQPGTNLTKMVDRFKRSYLRSVESVALSDIDIKGGCLGCCQCGLDGVCTYDGKDEFIDFYNSKVKNADILVFAGEIRDRYLSWKWKQFFDRRFFHTHIPSLTGKQIGFIISGPLRRIPNLRQILDAYSEWEQANLVDYITDEYEDSSEIDDLLQSLAERLVECADRHYVKPETFLGHGGRKIFRDDIWGRLRVAFQVDHQYYKKHGLYDFPQSRYKMRFFNWKMMLFTKIPAVRKIFSERCMDEMIRPHRNVISKMDQVSNSMQVNP
ncbi:MAG TPA: flavodoxin [Deltaproteobacteria bacterium]|nr:flavodoxin [Deltaproteobacteria bacterium]HEU20569.1 flavodoxin [Deltaproteobacteria bacterium]